MAPRPGLECSRSLPKVVDGYIGCCRLWNNRQLAHYQRSEGSNDSHFEFYWRSKAVLAVTCPWRSNENAMFAFLMENTLTTGLILWSAAKSRVSCMSLRPLALTPVIVKPCLSISRGRSGMSNASEGNPIQTSLPPERSVLFAWI